MASYKLFDSLADAEAAVPLSKPRLAVVNGTPICLARTPAGLFAVADACPHLGESLSKGTTNYLNEVICPWHSYRFSLESGAECRQRTPDLKRYPLRVEADGVYLEF